MTYSWPGSGVALTGVEDGYDVSWEVTRGDADSQRVTGPMFSTPQISWRNPADGVRYIILEAVAVGPVRLPAAVAVEVANFVDYLNEYAVADPRLRRAVSLFQYVTELEDIPDSDDAAGLARLAGLDLSLEHIQVAARLYQSEAFDMFRLVDATDAICDTLV